MDKKLAIGIAVAAIILAITAFALTQPKQQAPLEDGVFHGERDASCQVDTDCVFVHFDSCTDSCGPGVLVNTETEERFREWQESEKNKPSGVTRLRTCSVSCAMSFKTYSAACSSGQCIRKESPDCFSQIGVCEGMKNNAWTAKEFSEKIGINASQCACPAN
ncbi:MAG: hypothetical protein V1708_03430 [Candidatus Micrarchaeota archaeon]